MLTALVIGATFERERILRNLAVATNRLVPLRSLDGYPTSHELSRLFSATEADVALVDAKDPARFTEIASEYRRRYPSNPLIAISDAVSTRWEMASAVIPYSSTPEALSEALDVSLQSLRGGVLRNLYAFVPAKGGCGATTVAVNTAAALAGKLGKKTLLLDADLRCGLTASMLNLEPGYSTQDVIHSMDDMDTFQWRARVSVAHGFDVLPSNRDWRSQPPTWREYLQLLNLVENHYDTILVDLPEVIDSATLELVWRADSLFLVCTPELLAFKRAQERYEEFTGHGIPPERVKLLLNRWSKQDPDSRHIEGFLERPPAARIPNDYMLVRGALLDGKPVGPDTVLGHAFCEFAAAIAGVEVPKEAKAASGHIWGLLRSH